MIDFNVLQKSKKESAEYYVQYGNKQLIPFFQSLEELCCINSNLHCRMIISGDTYSFRPSDSHHFV